LSVPAAVAGVRAGLPLDMVLWTGK
jgi:hypothetical protein